MLVAWCEVEDFLEIGTEEPVKRIPKAVNVDVETVVRTKRYRRLQIGLICHIYKLP